MTSILFRHLSAVMGIAFLTCLSSTSISDSVNKEKEYLIWSGKIAPDQSAADRHFLLDFEPQFRRDECIVRVDYKFTGSRKEYQEFSLGRTIPIYLYRHQPTALLASGLDSGLTNNKGHIFLMFADECPQRFEIAEAAAIFIKNRDPRFKLNVSHQRIKPGSKTIDTRGSWIDDPDYDPEYWKQIKRGMRGDGEALFKIAEYNKKKGNIFSAFLNFGLAIKYLADGPLRERAINGKEEIWNALTPKKQDISNKALEQNIQKLESLQEFIKNAE